MQILISFLYLIIQLSIVGFIGWIMVALLGWAPFIAEPLKGIIRNVIYFIVFIVCALLIIGWLVTLIGAGNYSIVPPFLHSR